MPAWLLGCVLASAASDCGAPTSPVDCEALYEGKGVARDFAKALACYRASEAWPMVAIMQLNGEGTAADVTEDRILELDNPDAG